MSVFRGPGGRGWPGMAAYANKTNGLKWRAPGEKLAQMVLVS
jgi:hypothetical protein